MVESSGSRANSASCANSQHSGISKKASPIAGSDRVNHCNMKWVRSMVVNGNGGRPFLPSG